MQIDDVLRRLPQIGVRDVRDRCGKGALSSRLGQHRHDIRALAALADAHDQGVSESGRRSIDRVQTGGGQAYRKAVGDAQQVICIASSVITGATGRNQHMRDVPRSDGGGKRLRRSAFGLDQLRQNVRLLVNLPVEVSGFELYQATSSSPSNTTLPAQNVVFTCRSGLNSTRSAR